MEKLPILILIIFHFSFWWKFYTTDRLCTSEVVSNFFPHWLWMGRELRQWRFPMKDNIYYLEPGSIPFLSTFYPPSLLLTWLCALTRVNQNISFKLYSRMIYIHSLIGCILSYILMYKFLNFSVLISTFGALSLTYNAYMIRPQTPCFMFTAAWIPACLIPGWFGIFAFGMAVLGGYFPIILTGLPIFFFNSSCLLGSIIALPQLIPFFRYYPKSIRAKKRNETLWGKMPIKRFFIQLRWPENGMIHYPEYSFGIGICMVLCFLNPTTWWIPAIIGVLGSQGFFVLDRIPARFVYLVSFSLIMSSLNAIKDSIYVVPMIILQGFLLWKNRDIYPSFPFSQWWRKITEHRFVGKFWPNNTGYMNGIGHQKYYGGFSLAENYHE